MNPKHRAARKERTELLWKLAWRYEPSLVQLSTYSYFFHPGCLYLSIYIYICVCVYLIQNLVGINLKTRTKITEVLFIIYI
jgi:hypothetical protein